MDPASVCFHAQIASSTRSTSKLALRLHSSIVLMADWMGKMADAVEEAEAAQAVHAPQEEVPTEPATSLRSQIIEVPITDGRELSEESARMLFHLAQHLHARDQERLYELLDKQQAEARARPHPVSGPTVVEELQLPSLEYGPRPEPEKFAIKYILSGGGLPQSEYEELQRKALQAFNARDLERERQRAAAAEHEAHQRSIAEWESQIKARQLDHPKLPSGPPPQGTSSMRVLPKVHEALRQNDPSVTPSSQPAVKKAPPTLDRARPSVFYSDTAPPRIGSGLPVPPPAAPRPDVVPSVEIPMAAKPMTPSHPPRPPLSALPIPSSMETSTGANKHPLEQPAALPPLSKQVRCKAFPHPSHPQDQVYMAASATVEMCQPGKPCPKGPPASYMPTPPEIASMQTYSYEDDRKKRLNDQDLYLRIKSNRDIDWNKPLWQQLAPVLRGGPSPDKSQEELRALRSTVPDLNNFLLNGLYPLDNVITAIQKNHGVHKIQMQEVAAWVLNGTHWFSLLQQPMMIVIWCHDWEDGSRFQFLMQLLETSYPDYVPKYQILMYDDSKINGPCLQWQAPTTIWDGTPVLGFMAETFLDDLSSMGFKDFNPMWTYPTTAVYQCWDALTFGMPPWHLCKDEDRCQSVLKDALQESVTDCSIQVYEHVASIGNCLLQGNPSKRRHKGCREE